MQHELQRIAFQIAADPRISDREVDACIADLKSKCEKAVIDLEDYKTLQIVEFCAKIRGLKEGPKSRALSNSGIIREDP